VKNAVTIPKFTIGMMETKTALSFPKTIGNVFIPIILSPSTSSTSFNISLATINKKAPTQR